MATIPRRIRRYPGLVAAWKKRHKPRRRPRRRTTRRRRPTRRYRRRSYDPGVRTYFRRGKARAKGKLEGILSKIEKKLVPLCDLIGFGIGLGLPMKASYAYCKEHGCYGGKLPAGCSFWDYLKWIPFEFMHLFGTGKTEEPGGAFGDPLFYLQWKFTNPESHWSKPFLGSLIATILCKLGLVDMALSLITSKSKRISKPIEKIATGALIATTIGALAFPGSTPSKSYSSYNPTSRSYVSSGSMWS